MKVKKFRIRPRIPTVGRILKTILGTRQLPSEVEQSLPIESDKFLAHVMPTAFYQTWSRDRIPVEFAETIQSAGLTKSVAISAVVATIGQQPEEYLSELILNGESQRSQVVTALSEEAAELSFQFLIRLLTDDAKNDDCEVSEPLPITDGGLLKETLRLMEADQEGVTIDSAMHLTPRFTRVALVAWTPVAKKKKSAVSSKKRTN